MTSILDNELIKKYFDCRCSWHPSSDDHDSHIAKNVLWAQQEPIKAGEKVLVIPQANQNYECKPEMIWEYEYPKDVSGLHVQWLRLPSRFQAQEKKECPNLTVQCSCSLKIDHPKSTCSHCTGVLEKHQCLSSPKCLCTCHQPAPPEEKKECFYNPPFINSHINCSHPIPDKYQPKPSEAVVPPSLVEEKIKQICQLPWAERLSVLQYSLHELVELVRKEYE